MQTRQQPAVGDILDALFGEQPFFGGRTFGYQGDSARHVFMIAALSLALRADRPVNVLEVGSWVGSSTLSFAQAIRTFSKHGGTLTCVDSWTPYLSPSDVSKGGIYATFEELLSVDLPFHLFKHNTKSIGGNVTLQTLRGSSADILPTLAPQSFDFIYIDASHYYADVLNDLRCSTVLLRDGGILCGDDLELQFDRIDVAAARQKLDQDYVMDPKTGQHFHPGVTLAVAEFFGRTVSSTIGFWAAAKHGSGYRDVSFDGLPSVIPSHLSDALKAHAQTFLTAGAR